MPAAPKPSRSSTPADPPGARLVRPASWVVDPRTCTRLAAVLATLPPDVAGVVAPLCVLPPGSSVRVHAEHQDLEWPRPAAPDAEILRDGHVRGALLVRDGVEATAGRDQVSVTPGTRVVVDRGAPVYDPWDPPPPSQDASDTGRPAFPWRPIAALLLLEDDPNLPDWARATANALLRADVEARLLLADPAMGLHLTMPCAPTAASIAALSPDVIVTCDPTAFERAHEWCEPLRSTTVVALDDALGAGVETVPWTIGRAQGRLRGRIGRDAPPRAIAELIFRLAAGPQPTPPTHPSVAARIGRVAAHNPATPRPARVLAVLDGADRLTEARVGGILDRLRTAGYPVERAQELSGRHADLVLVTGPAAAVSQCVALDRDGDRQAAIVHVVGTRDLADTAAVPDLHGGRRIAGLVVPSPTVARSLRNAGRRALAVPTLLTVAREREVLAHPPAPTANRLGWHVEHPDDVTDLDLAPSAHAVLELLRRHPDLHLEITGAAHRLPDALTTHPRVITPSGDSRIAALRRWTAQLWTATRAAVVAGATHAVLEAALLGIPTVPLGVDRALIEDDPQLTLLTTESGGDGVVATRLCPDPALAARAAALVTGAGAAAHVRRLVGWATYGVASS